MLVPLTDVADAEIEALLDIAFGPDRHGRTAYAIRDGMRWLAPFSYAARGENGAVAGVLQSWPVELRVDGGNALPLIMVGPVAVLPALQNEGLGRMMMSRLVADTDKHADAHLMMIGDPEYYGRFWDFRADLTGQWRAPGPVEQRRLLMRAVPRLLPFPKLAGMLGPRSD